MSDYQHIIHPFEPIWSPSSRILILGSLPSVQSRAQMFYYGNERNRFWRVVASVLGEDIPQTIEQKTDMLLRRDIALWDVIRSCDIIGSGDSTIRNAVPNDIGGLIQKTQIERIYANGGTAARLYAKFIEPETGMAAIPLPSTSPANAAWSTERLCGAWQCITGGEKA